ncbi:MAG: cytochrome c biogenesis protein ResB [Bacteroidales bacterium]
MRKLKNMLFSMELTGMLLILFAVAAGVATFIENDFGTVTAKAKVYNAKWFEFLLLLLAINMVGSIFKNKMYLKHKWTILLFHVSFLIIFVGAAVTRYIGYEGMMSIREGKASNEIRSDETYIRVWASGNGNESYQEDKVQATPIDVQGHNTSLSLNNRKIEVKVLEYFMNAGETMVEAEGGMPVIWLVFSGDGSGRQNVYLREGEIKKFGGYEFGFNIRPTGLGIYFTNENDELLMVSSDSVSYMNMAANITTMLAPDSSHQLLPMSLYNIGNNSFVLKQYFRSAKTKLVSTEGQEGMSNMDAFVAKVTVGDVSKEVNVYGGKGFLSTNSEVDFGDVTVTLNYGSKPIKLPFAIRLDDFQLERYPGSNSPSSYASEVTVIDESKDLVMPYRIFMNNVLNYGGYRFSILV